MEQAASIPRPSASADPVLDELIEQCAGRLEAGEPVDVEELARLHPEQAEQLRKLLPAMQALAELSRASGAASGEGPSRLAPGVDLPAGILGDFRLLREVGRGGMGVVYEAEQISLGRRVALKVLPFAATMDPRQLQRFLNEARAAASLEHPHIVPVYGVGCERAVHFYAMKFIDGRTLAESIAERRARAAGTVSAEPSSGSPPSSPVSPSTETALAAKLATESMLPNGAFFRRVAEWGVQAGEALDHAHALGVVHRDVKPANLMVDGQGNLWVTDFGLARVGADAGLTMTGDVLGTLRYMSPEQALAKHGLVDHRSDVYALGATLYELLTLRPAVDGKDREEILRNIAFAEPAPPRSLDRGIPVDLETITLKALAKEPAERYATAKELADDLRRWLEDRPIRAKRPSLAQRLRKWRRRHRGLVRAAAVLVLALLLLGGAALWREQQQRAAVERAVEANLERVKVLQEQERYDEALAVLAVAEGQLEGRGLGTLRERVKQLKRDVGMLVGLEQAYLQPAAAGKEAGFDHAGADRHYAEAFSGYDLDMAALSPEEAAKRVRMSAISKRLIMALDDWSNTKEKLKKGDGAPLRTVADLADENTWSRRLRGAVRNNDRSALEKLAEQDEWLSQPTANLVVLGRDLRDAGSHTAERLLRRAQQAHPADFWINLDLADLLLLRAHGHYEVGRAAGLVPAGFILPTVLKKPPDLAEAVGFYRGALALRPRSAVVYNNLGTALKKQGKLAEAMAAYRKAIDLQHDLPWLHFNLGLALADQDKPAEAETAFRTAIELQLDHAEGYLSLGNALKDQRKLDEAIAAFRKAIDLKDDYAEAYNNLGAVLFGQKKLDEAVAAYRKAIAFKPDAALAHSNLGTALGHLNRPAEAEAAYRKAIELKPDYAEAYEGLGIALRRQKKLDEAVAIYRKAHQVLPNHPGIQNNLRQTERWLALDRQLPAIFAGKAKPSSPQEEVELALVCVLFKERYRAAVGFFADAFAAEPELADDLQRQHRCNAACAAALAGCGHGKDADQSDPKERSRLRRQALAWLRADLTVYRRLLEKESVKAGPVIRDRMQHWLGDPDFNGVRGPAALDKLPNAAERQEWQKLWQEVEALRQRAADPPKPASPARP